MFFPGADSKSFSISEIPKLAFLSFSSCQHLTNVLYAVMIKKNCLAHNCER